MKRTLAIIACLSLAGCAVKFPGTKDSTVEVARIIAATQTEAIKALAEVLKVQKLPPCSPTEPLGGVMQWDYMGPGAKPCFWTDEGGVTHGTRPYWPPPTPSPSPEGGR